MCVLQGVHHIHMCVLQREIFTMFLIYETKVSRFLENLGESIFSLLLVESRKNNPIEVTIIRFQWVNYS